MRMKVEKGRGGRRVEEIGGREKESMKGESLEQHNVLMTRSYGTMWPDELWVTGIQTIPDSQAHALSAGSGHKQTPRGRGRRVGQELVHQIPLKAEGHHWHLGEVFPPLYTAAVAAKRGEEKGEEKYYKWQLYFIPIL